MNYKRMEVLVAINQFKNISKTAQYLNLKQPTVSFHMRSLEEEVGATLFRTRSNRTILTDAGKALLFYAEKILNLSNEAKKMMENYFSVNGYNITIGSSSVPSVYLLPEIISQFMQKYPELSINVTVMPAPEIQRLTAEYKISLGIVSSTDLLLDNLEYSKLCTDEMVLVFSPKHPFSNEKKITKVMLEKERFILHNLNSTTRILSNQWADDIGLNLKAHLEISSSEAIKQAVLCNIGVTILSKLSVQQEIRNGLLNYTYLPEYSPTRNIYAIYNQDRYMPPILKEFIDLLHSNFIVNPSSNL